METTQRYQIETALAHLQGLYRQTEAEEERLRLARAYNQLVDELPAEEAYWRRGLIGGDVFVSDREARPSTDEEAATPSGAAVAVG